LRREEEEEEEAVTFQFDTVGVFEMLLERFGGGFKKNYSSILKSGCINI